MPEAERAMAVIRDFIQHRLNEILPSFVTVQPESVPDPKTPAAKEVAMNDRKIPKLSPAINFKMQAFNFR